MKPRFPRCVVVLSLLALSTLDPQLSTVSAQNIVFTYQGRVTDNGTNFSGTGLFKFALVTSTNNSHTAMATAVMGGSPPHEFVNSYNVTYGGSGYVSVPNVTISGGGGSGAVAMASINGGGVVTGVTVINPGSGYTGTPVVTIDPAPANISYTTYWSNDGSSSAGSEPAAAVGVGVSGGLFIVVLGDPTQPNMAVLNALLFTQPNLQLRIWFDDGINGSVVLNPVQNLTPTPYAIQAVNASSASNLLGTLPVSQLGGIIPAAHLPASVVTNNAAGLTLAGTFTGNGTGLTGVNATKLGGLTSANFWQTNGNAGANPTNGAFIGTTDNLPLEFRVNGQRALRIEYATNNSYGYSPNIIGGYPGNIVSNGFAGAAIGGGGLTNFPNRVGNHFATVVGGFGNTASGFGSTAMGTFASAIHNYSFVWSGDNTIVNGATFSSTSDSQFAVKASGGVRLVGYVTTGDLSLSENGAYHKLSLSGGNSTGYLYGSYAKWGDGVHLGYNYYADAIGDDIIPVSAGGTSRISADYGEIVLAVGTANTAPNIVRLDATTTGVGISRSPAANALEVEGNASKTSAGSWLANSDARIKTDIHTVTNALDKLAQVRLVQFRYTDEYRTQHPSIENRSYLNVIAQEFQQVFPEAVTSSGEKLPNGDAILQVDTYPLTIYSAAAIQELNQKLNERDEEIQALKQSVTDLKQMVQSLAEKK